MVERLWFAEDYQRWPRPLRTLADAQLRRRRSQWNTQHAKYRTAVEARAKAVAQNRPPGSDDEQRRTWNDVARISIREPVRPTWLGDRVYAVSRQLDDEYRLDAATVWPALWLTVARALGIAHEGVMNAQTGRALTLLLQGRANRVETTAGWPQAPPA